MCGIVTHTYSDRSTGLFFFFGFPSNGAGNQENLIRDATYSAALSLENGRRSRNRAVGGRDEGGKGFLDLYAAYERPPPQPSSSISGIGYQFSLTWLSISRHWPNAVLDKALARRFKPPANSGVRAQGQLARTRMHAASVFYSAAGDASAFAFGTQL